MSFEKTIQIYSQKFEELLKKYSENDVIPSQYKTNIVENLKISTKNLFDSLTPLYQQHSIQMQKGAERLDTNYAAFVKKVSSRKNVFLQDLAKNTKEHSAKILEIKTENEKKIRGFTEQIRSLLKDKEMNTASTEQIIVVLEAQKKDNLETLNYQATVAKQNYTSFILKVHESLEKKNAVIHAASSKRTFKFDESNKSVLDFLNKKILEMNQKYESVQREYEQEQLKINDAVINQSTKLNNKINTLNVSKNEELNGVKAYFDAEMKKIDNQRKEIRLEFSNKNKEILKKFAQNLTDIDSLNEVLFHKHQNEKDQLTRKFYYDNFNFDKEYFALQNEYQDKINKVSKKNNAKEVKLVKINLKIKEKQFSAYKKEVLRSQKKQLDEIEHTYIKESEHFKLQKYIEEVEKNYNILNLTMEEKNAHDRLNGLEEILEHDYNTKVFEINKKFYSRANELRSNNEIRNKLFQKDSTKLELKYQEILESISKDRLTYSNDTVFQKELENIVHNKENSIFNKEKSLNEVLTLLEIEKNKILANYNTRNFTLLSKKESENVAFEVSKITTATQYANQLISHEIEKLKQRKIDETNQCGVLIMECQNKETAKRNILTKQYLRDINLINQDLYLNRYRMEKMIAMISHNFFSEIIAKYTLFLTTFFNEIRTTLLHSYPPLQSILTFVNDILGAGSNLYYALFDNYNSILQDLFEKRITFETGFKYKNRFSELEEKYRQSEKKILTKQESFEATLANYNQTITVFTNKIWTLENELHVLAKETSKSGTSTDEKQELSHKLFKAKAELKEFTKKNEVSKKLKTLMEHDLAEIPAQLNRNKKKYELEYKKIYKEQHKESLVYYKCIQQINKTCNFFKEHFNSHLQKSELKLMSSYKLFTTYLDDLSKLMITNTLLISNSFKMILDYTIREIKKENKENIRKVEKEYRQSLKDVLLQDKNITIETRNSAIEFNRKKIENQRLLALALSNLKKEQDSLTSDMVKKYKTSIKNLDEEIFDNCCRFKINLYATIDNIASLNNKETKHIKALEQAYKIERINLTSKYENNKKEIDNKYNNTCINIKNQLTNLPYIIKMQSKQINQSTKEDNRSIKSEIIRNNLLHKNFIKQMYNEFNINYSTLNKNIVSNNIDRNYDCKEIRKKYKTQVKQKYNAYLKQNKMLK